jgi:iron complex outermembrane receptor protein
MVDGRSIYIDAQGIVLWKLLPVTLPEIKRIEVLKGPASAVYGFNAFDGIINIITKSPEEMKGTTLQFGGGSYGTIMASAIQAGTVDKFGYRLSIGQNQNASWSNSSSLAFRDYLFNIQTEYAFSELSKLTVSGGLVDSNRWDGPLQQDTVVALKPSQAYTHVTYQHSDLVVHAFWNRFDAPSVQQFNPLIAPFQVITGTNGSQTSPTLTDSYNVDVQHSLNFGPANQLTYGANYRLNTLSSDFISGFSREDRLGFYIQDEWKLAQPFRIVTGLRYDMDTFINPTYSPRVALFYNPSQDHTFRLSGSVAFRPPTLFDKNVSLKVSTNPPLPPVTASLVGGANISPEEIVSYEAEYQGWYLKHRLRARGALFFNHISDLVSAQNTSPTSVTIANDPGSADIHGVEIGAEFLATKWLTAFANYSYQDIHQTFTGRVQRAGPHNKFNVGLRGEWDNGLNAEAIFHYYGSVAYPPGQSFTSFSQAGLVALPNPNASAYTLLNFRGGYKFWQQKAEAGYLREAEVALSVFNALNDKHQEYPLGETIGSRVMGWLTVRY